ncbi:formate dehydrogenase accessory sulfurtransferase FdhD [Alkalicoccobacillus porphyridii]|uniref:Sulfur carrier protein FdhD n=1 Tax=Alkalicoccobacillus porphyridii TaxID=2597270 RepID=A0A553ZVA4_9BACI|nr:formate dehydrogenase accessory sulfurtransferase FdhD [Alkalicoccobacillus porphyridii]TSB45353.1 formate dehydrogenase accessory sulfurtransferase FdhD [Alkalicoccobacillus porphyridii]
MENKAVTKRSIRTYKESGFQEVEDIVATEYPLTLKVNGEELVTMVCSPDHLEDLAIGYLASEGLLKKYSDVKRIRLDEKKGFIHLELTHLNALYDQLQNKRYLSSCCGGSRQGFVFAHDALTAKSMKTRRSVQISPEVCLKSMQSLQESAETFKETGGVHNAALCNDQGIILSRMDIGRHNALDKIYGYCLRNQISLDGTFVVFSGRISSEILLKTAKIGCELVLSKSAPTERALELAEELGITTVGFIRGNSFNVYTYPERIK